MSGRLTDDFNYPHSYPPRAEPSAGVSSHVTFGENAFFAGWRRWVGVLMRCTSRLRAQFTENKNANPAVVQLAVEERFRPHADRRRRGHTLVLVHSLRATRDVLPIPRQSIRSIDWSMDKKASRSWVELVMTAQDGTCRGR